jgi:hypothetical protein
MADDRRPFLDLRGIDGGFPGGRHPGGIVPDPDVAGLSDAGTGMAGRWVREAGHRVDADPDAPVLPAGSTWAGAGDLDFGAGAGPGVADESGRDPDPAVRTAMGTAVMRMVARRATRMPPTRTVSRRSSPSCRPRRRGS